MWFSEVAVLKARERMYGVAAALSPSVRANCAPWQVRWQLFARA